MLSRCYARWSAVRSIDRIGSSKIKWDVSRAIAEITASSVRLHSRKRKPLNGYFPELVETLGKLKSETFLDSEVVVLFGAAVLRLKSDALEELFESWIRMQVIKDGVHFEINE